MNSFTSGRSAMLALVVLAAVGCNRQQGYHHRPKEFSEIDKHAIQRVQEMPLGQMPVMQSIASEYTDEERHELEPCSYEDYEVAKVIRRDLKEIQGRYLEQLHVICSTGTGESSFRFDWVFDMGESESYEYLGPIREFNFGLDPSEIDKAEN